MTTCTRCGWPTLLPPLCTACSDRDAEKQAEAIAEADARAKAVHEFYSTPRWVVDEALDTIEHIADQHDAELGAVLAAAQAGALVVDPAMGGVVRDGRIVERPVYLDALRERFPNVGGADCRHTSAATHIDGTHLCPFEMLRRDLLDGCVLAATNPPFSLYRRFVERGLEVAESVVLLLPVGVMEVRRRTTAEDVAWWRKYGPRWLVTHRRIRFGGATSSAFQFYAHFVWMRADVGSGMLPRMVSADGVAAIQQARRAA